MKTAVACLGCIVLVVFVIYICTKMMKLNRTVVEGLISKKKETLTPDELLKQAEAFRAEQSDRLNIKKYGATYKKLLITLEDICHLSMIANIKSIDTKTGSIFGSFGTETVKLLESTQKTIEALSSIDEFLTHHKPASSSSSIW